MLAALVVATALACLPPEGEAASAVGADELLALRDLSGLSVSPDGRRMAFQVQQADLETNGYRSVWCVAQVASNARAIAIADGGDIAMPILPVRERRTGVWSTLAARWSPDGAWVGFLGRRGGETQIEICRSDGAGCTLATRSAGDVDDFVWTADGSGLVFRAAPSREEAARPLALEGDGGFRLDERFDVFHSFTPIRSHEPRPPAMRYVDLATGAERAATQPETDRFLAGRRPAISTIMGTSRVYSIFSAAPTPAPDFLRGADMRSFVPMGEGAVWTEPADPALGGNTAPLVLFAAHGSDYASAMRCASPSCVGRIVEFAPTPDGTQVFFIRREGWAASQHGLYLWNLARGEVRRVLLTDDVIRVCAPLAARAICYREGPTRPRSIVAMDYADGRAVTLFDANPDLPDRAFARARKLEWRSPRGDEVFGYLLTPPGRRSSRPLPLIVVQYRAGGFLRGGVGDEYPIQAFVRRGFAVLVLERPDPTALLASVRDGAEIDRREWEGLSERRRTLAALTSGIDQVVALGVADRARIGVTGLSDGAETTVFALIHCNCIAAAAISSGVHDPSSLYFASDGERRAMRAGGRGESRFGEGALWPDLSLSLNVERVRAPILAQVADRELVFMLEAHRTFTDLGRPFDLYVFPNEYHVKWQPRHRRAIYERSLDWFSFWLLDEEDSDPAKTRQYEIWRNMRERAG